MAWERGGGVCLTKDILAETGDYVLGIEREYTRRPDLRLCHPYIPEGIRSEAPDERTGKKNRDGREYDGERNGVSGGVRRGVWL